MDIESYATLGLAAIAVGVSVAAWKASHRSAKAAEASVVEAKRSADASERAASAGEQQAAAAAAALEMQREAARPRVSLRISWIGKGTWLLTNDGDAAAENPVLDPGDAGEVDWEEPLGARLEAGGSRRLHASYPASTPTQLRFTWDGQDEPVPVRCPPQA